MTIAAPRMLHADPGTRRLVAWLMAGLLVAGVIAILFVMPWLTRRWEVLPGEAVLREAQMVLFLGVAPSLPAAVALFLYGVRIVKTLQSPPPGSKVLVDTPVREGAGVRLWGVAVMLIACLVAFAALRALVIVPPLLEQAIQPRYMPVPSPRQTIGNAAPPTRGHDV